MLASLPSCSFAQPPILEQSPLGENENSCRAVNNPREPKLTAWNKEDRAQLIALRSQGVVAVRYNVQGCNVELEVLPNCIGTGKYAFTPTPSQKKDYVFNTKQLFAELPLGAAGLSGKLSGNRVLRTDEILVGVAALPSAQVYYRQSLAGQDCSRATHVVARVYLGGFVMAAGEERTFKSEATLFGLGAGASADSKIERLEGEGIPAVCAKAMEEGNESPLCSVPLRIGLVELAESPPPASPTASTVAATGAAQAQPPPSTVQPSTPPVGVPPANAVPQGMIELPGSFPGEYWKPLGKSEYAFLVDEWCYPSLRGFKSRYRNGPRGLQRQNSAPSPQPFVTEWVDVEVFLSNRGMYRIRHANDWPGNYWRAISKKNADFYENERSERDDGTIHADEKRMVMSCTRCKISSDGGIYECK